jgi:hypothetical protein
VTVSACHPAAEAGGAIVVRRLGLQFFPPRPSDCPKRRCESASRRNCQLGVRYVGALGAADMITGSALNRSSPEAPKPGEPGEALREAPDAGDAPRPSTCRAAAPVPMPVVRSAATPAIAHGGERRQHQGRRARRRSPPCRPRGLAADRGAAARGWGRRSRAGSRAMFTATRRASSSVSTLACIAPAAFARL